MKVKIKAYYILALLALVSMGYYLSLPEKGSIRKAPEYTRQVEESKDYPLYIMEGGSYQEESLALPQNLTEMEVLREILVAILKKTDPKLQFQNIYLDGKVIFLSFKGKPSKASMASIRKSLAGLGREEEVRVLVHEK